MRRLSLFSAPSILPVAAVALALAAASAAAAETLREVPVNGDFSVTSLGWDSSHGEIRIAWAVLDLGGQAHVCGATSPTSGFASQNTRAAMRKGWVKLNDQKILKGLEFFAKGGMRSELASLKARCKPVDIGSGAGRSFLLGFDPVRVRL